MSGDLLKLTPRQRLFVDEYVLCNNASEAARRAGYSEKTAGAIATENLQKPAIRQAIAALRSDNAARLDLTRQDVLAGILEAIEMARVMADPAAMLAGYRDLARMCGFNEPEVHRVEASPSASAVVARFVAMTDDELAALVSGRA
jgi:phage terminase small subunit